MVRCHFPDGIDNSGFVGWLAGRIESKTGSSIFVVCGQNSDQGGIYDYWGCPVEAADAVLSEVLAITTGTCGPRRQPASKPASLNGRRMGALLGWGGANRLPGGLAHTRPAHLPL